LGGIQQIQRAGAARGKGRMLPPSRPATLEQWGIVNRVAPAEKPQET
jgi:hypothetical protein